VVWFGLVWFGWERTVWEIARLADGLEEPSRTSHSSKRFTDD